MGNVTCTAPAVIVCKLDNDCQAVTAGSNVVGKIYLEVLHDRVECTSIQLQISGSERTVVHYTTHSGSGKNRKTHHHVARSRHYFWKINVPIGQFNDYIPKGNYEFPFQCQIPAGLPGSMATGGRNWCSVGYTVEACLHRKGLLTWDVKHALNFAVCPAPALVQHSPMYLEPRFVDVYTCCCFNRGRMLTGGSSGNSIVAAGEVMRVNYAVQNESTSMIKAIEVMLVERVSFQARGHHASSVSVLFEKRLSASTTNNETRIEDLYLMPTKRQGKLQSVDDDFTQLQLIKQMLDSGKYSIDVLLPSTARASFKGTLLEVSHRLHITVRTSMGTANPTISHPVFVVNRQMVYQQPLQQQQVASNAIAPMQVPEELPNYWQAISSPMYVVPVTAYATSSVTVNDGAMDGAYFDQSMFSPSDSPMAIAVAINGPSSGGGVLETINAAIDPVNGMKLWMQSNNVNSLTPLDYYSIFSSISQAYYQANVADTMSTGLEEISCAALAQAARGSADYCRREVVENLVKGTRIIDKQNRELVKAQLSAFQFMCIEQHFQ